MEVFNQNKDELIKAIDREIEKNDAICNKLSRNIQKYSEKRLQNLNKERDQQAQLLDKLKIAKKSQLAILSDLQQELQFQRQEQQSFLQQISKKQQYQTQLRKELLFLQEKIQQQQPHLQSFLQQNEKSKKSNNKIEYAKNKLRSLELKHQKQCQEVQYKYKLVKLMKETLRQKRQLNQKQLILVEKKDTYRLTAFDYCSIKQNGQEIGAKDTEFSQNQIQSTFKHFCD